ncbi:hypothetical protein LIER_11265 [Lithospermum erythrorhizon]|uniref:Reverse transcriptase zinc-binding domain-containing protein n=1 Tax=Lithospermum erythrorhizon TaxID=34254 RepID=A0AAV3PMQ7_LITER
MSSLSSGYADVLLWKGSRTYNSTRVWHSLRIEQSRVRLHKLIWFDGHVPKHNFIVWLLCRGRLKTKDMLCKWNIIVYSVRLWSTCSFFVLSLAAAWRNLSGFVKDFH